MNIIRDLQNSKLPNGLTLREDTLLRALKLQATTGILMTNPRVTGYTSFAKAILALQAEATSTVGLRVYRGSIINILKEWFPDIPRTRKSAYKYLVKKGEIGNG